MARATDLPIYRDAYELLLLITKLAQQYPRGYRQGLARDVCTVAQSLVTSIFQANCTTEKTPIIEVLREQLQTLQLLMPAMESRGMNFRVRKTLFQKVLQYLDVLKMA